MKKLRFAVAMLLALAVIFSFTACDEKQDGITMKYATVSLSFTDEDGEERNEDIVIKLYVNYAPAVIDRVTKLAEKSFYNDTVVNNAMSGWFTLGGYKMDGDKMVKVNSDLGAINYGDFHKKDGKPINLRGEFYNGGLSGNTLTVSEGSVIMYRDFANNAGHNYGTEDCTLAICTSSSAPFTANDYAIIGKIEDKDDLKLLSEIVSLASREGEDEDDETEYNYYYAGGIAELAESYRTGSEGEYELTNDAIEAEIELEDIEKVVSGGEQYFEAGFISMDDYAEFKPTAEKFINAHGDKSATFFFNVPLNPVTVKGVKITNKI